MPRKKNEIPEARKRYNRGSWVIYWRYGGEQFSVSTGLIKPADSALAEKIRRAFSIRLAEGGAFEPPYDRMGSVIRYLEKRYGVPAAPVGGGNWIADYTPYIQKECSQKWANMSLSFIRGLEAFAGRIDLVDKAKAEAFLLEILSAHATATRNRCLAACSRFFKWVVRTERTKTNPFGDVKTLKEERLSDIVYCTPEERDEIIALAAETGRPEWMAVPIAFYAGMRREEISRLEWPDVRFTEGKIVVRRTKTKKGRTIPLNAKLEALLSSRPAAERSGYVVKIAGGIDRLLRLDNLIRTIQKTKRAALLKQWSIPRPKPSRSKEYGELKAAWLKAKEKRDAELKAVMERIGWNPFRHTFGSLLAQAGVSLDKISAWMGNTPEVCKRHYAQFVPRDRRDHEIDKM